MKKAITGESGVGAFLSSRGLIAFQYVLVTILLLVLVIDGIDIQLLSLVSPLIIEEWGVERSEFGPALAGALIGMSLGSLAGGVVGDKFGRRTTLVASTLLFGLATVLAGMSESVIVMTVMRIISGVGFGAAAPNAIALANDWLPARIKPQVTSLLSVGTPAGGMIGASLVMAFAPVWGWRGTFFACGVLTVLLCVAILAVVSESPSYLIAKGKADAARDVIRKRLSVEIPDEYLEQQQSGAAPDPAGRSFLDRGNLRLNIGAGLGFFSMALVSYGYIVWTPILLTSLGFSMSQALTAIFSFNVAAVSAAILAGVLMAAFGSKRVMAASSLLLLIVTIALAVLLEAAGGNPDSQARSITYVLLGGAGGFAGAAMASIYSMMAVGYPVWCRAGGIGFGMMLGRAGGIVASFAGGYLIDAGSGGAWPFLGFLAVNAAIGLACTFISDRHVEPSRRGS